MKKTEAWKFAIAALVTASTLLSAFAAGPWSGKKVSIVGDSYSTWSTSGEDITGADMNPYYPDGGARNNDVKQLPQMWWMQVLDSLGGTLECNCSEGGSRICMDAEADGAMRTSFLNRAKDGALGSPDVILVFGGTNDSWQDTECASSFASGCDAFFAMLKTTYPRAVVYVILPKEFTETTGVYARYRETQAECALKYGFKVIDLDGAYAVAASDGDYDSWGHPKASAMKKIADRIIATVSATGAAPTSLAPNGTTLATQRGTTSQEGYHKWFYAKSDAERRTLCAGGYRIRNTREPEQNRYRWIMATECTDKPLEQTFSWSGGVAPYRLRIVRANGTVFLSRSGIAGTSTKVDSFEIATDYKWTVTDATGKTSVSASFTTEANVPRLLNGAGNTVSLQSFGKSDYYYSWDVPTPHGVRDVGGYVGIGGRRSRQGLIIRTSELDEESEYGADSFIDYKNNSFWRYRLGIRHEIDLRNTTESQITRSVLGDDVNFTRFDAFPRDPMTTMSNSKSRNQVRDAVRIFANLSNYPVAFHCVHGKDRTGFLALVLGGVLGYSESDLRRDYETTMFWHTTQNDSILDPSCDWFKTNRWCQSSAPATIADGIVNYVKKIGVSDAEIQAIRDVMYAEDEPSPDPGHEHTPVAVPAVAATYATPGRTAGTKCAECGEVLSVGEAIPVIASRPTCSAQVAADGKAKLEFANVLAPVVVSVVYGNEDRGEEYFRDSDADGGDEPYGWDHWEVVAFVPAGTTSYDDYAIPGWGTTATHARFLVTPYEQTPKATLETIVATDPARQILDTGFSPNGGTRLNLTMKLGVDPANKTLVDTPSAAADAIAYGIAFDASRHPVYVYDSATYVVNAAAVNGNDIKLYMNWNETNKTGWRTKIGGSTYYANGKPAAPSAKTTDGTIRVHGLGAFSPITLADAQGATQAYFAPATGFDAAGNEVVAFLDTISMTMHTSVGASAFAKGPAYADYHKDLLANVTMLAATATIGAGVWTQPADDSPEAIRAALAAVGFDEVTQTAITTPQAYLAFRTYCEQTVGLTDPKDEAKAGVKANALLGYALGAETVPNVAISSGDVEIVSVERDADAVVVGVAVRGIDPCEERAVQSALDAVLSATGGEKVTAMSAETVSVSGKVQNDALSVTVTPKQTGASSFFVRIVIRNERVDE